jgi:UDP-4-amino-4,6-dideoxy-N-acetyl-beta-L-altrosamine N-acetyltransferase
MTTLRALTAKDAEITWQWRNLPAIKYFFAGHPFPVNYDKEAKWLASTILENIPHTYFGVEHNGQLVGITSLRNIDLLNRQAEFAIFIIETRGVGHEATNQTLTFAFQDLGLERVWLKVIDSNAAAIKLYQKCGFIDEGIMRKSVFKNGQFVDQIMMSILKDEFLKK